MSEYKASMFNYIMNDCNDDVYIYNTFMGSKSISKISPKNRKKVVSLLSSNKIVNCDENLLDILHNKGFIVPKKKDEKRQRDFFYANFLNDDTLRLVIHTTKACNFRCKYCSLEFTNEHLTEAVQKKILRFIQKRLYRYNKVEINWFGGEPLLNIDAIENISNKVIELCKRSKKLYYGTITTNGYLLTPDNIEKLVKLKVTNYTVTLDGLQGYHDNLRVLKSGKPTFEVILSNLLYIKEKIKNSNIRVFIRTNMTRKMVHTLESYYNFYNDNFQDDVRFSLLLRPVVDGGGDAIKEMKSDLLTKEETDDMLSRVSKFSKESDINFKSNIAYLEPGGYCCVAMMFGKFTIDTYGKVYKCDVIDEETTIGILDEHGSLIHAGLNEADWVAGPWRYDSECEDCSLSAICFKGSCPMQRLINGYSLCEKKHNNTEVDALIRLYVASHEVSEI